MVPAAQVRPPLKIIMFPVHRPGDLISGEWEHFFHILEIFLFSQHYPHSFYTTGKNILKKKDFAASRLATIMATRWTGNKLFFKNGLMPTSIGETLPHPNPGAVYHAHVHHLPI